MQAESDPATPRPRSDARPSLSAEDGFARVVEASPSALVLAGQSGQIEMVNQQAERMFGYDRAALLGEPLELLLPHNCRRRHADLRSVFLTEMSTRAMHERRGLLGLRQDGTEFPVGIGLNPIQIDGESMVLAAIIDASAQCKIELENER